MPSATGSPPAPTSSRCPGVRLSPAPARPRSPATPSPISASTRWCATPPGTVSGTGGVLYAAFTGKAALVMSRKGTPGLDHPQPDLPGLRGDRRPRSSRSRRRSPPWRRHCPALGIGERTIGEARLRSLRLRLADMHKPRFVLNEQSIVRDAALIVLDEVSMVGEEMARDLLAFGKPILVLGRSRAAAADQGRGCVHPRPARRHADRDPPSGRRERHHPARHHGAGGSADPVWRARPARLEAAARRAWRRSSCSRAAR